MPIASSRAGRASLIGVSVLHKLRGVGKNMQDQASYPVVGVQTANERSNGLPLAGEVMRWLFTGEGLLTHSPPIVTAPAMVLEASATPDHVTFALGSFKGGARFDRAGCRQPAARATAPPGI